MVFIHDDDDNVNHYDDHDVDGDDDASHKEGG